MKMKRSEWRELAAEVQNLARISTIDAIKYLRQRVNCGLKEAYDAVNQLRNIPPVKP